MAQSYRDPNATAESSEAGTGDAADADVALLENTVQAALASFEQSVGALEYELEAGLAGEQLLLGSPGIAAAMAPVAGPQASLRAPGTAEPGRSVRPADLPGWERIHEGSFLEAVLLTQLTGDFPGPVLATVSVPFYSADRQRVLIPRGARVVGTARAVQDPDQSRLAVAFHRLLLPDGSWIDLEFTGLNQAGEGALQDQVDRHYFSTFAAAGAIGVVSGLALAGGSPFGLRAGVGQGLGQSATSVLDRFLNRLPTITIRAGHRLRVWFTSDVPGPQGRDTAMTNKELIMRHRSLTTALLVLVLMLASAGPANALFDIGGVIQRAQMIVNQATQIANQIRQMRTMTRQLTELEEQLDYMKEVARGEVDGLIEPFAELAAGSIGLVGDGLDWGSEFSGAAGELVAAVRGMGSGELVHRCLAERAGCGRPGERGGYPRAVP